MGKDTLRPDGAIILNGKNNRVSKTGRVLKRLGFSYSEVMKA